MDVPGSRTDVERFRRLDAAFRTGDMTALKRELGSLEGFPNVVAHPAIGACLTYAIYHSPLPFVARGRTACRWLKKTSAKSVTHSDWSKPVG